MISSDDFPEPTKSNYSELLDVMKQNKFFQKDDKVFCISIDKDKQVSILKGIYKGTVQSDWEKEMQIEPKGFIIELESDNKKIEQYFPRYFVFYFKFKPDKKMIEHCLKYHLQKIYKKQLENICQNMLNDYNDYINSLKNK